MATRLIVSASDSVKRAEGSFDYRQLPAALRAAVSQEAAEIHALVAATAVGVVQIGLRLRLVRQQLGRDSFSKWLRAEFHWSRPVASNLMRVAQAFGTLDYLAQFQPSALYVLARKKVSLAARDEALRLAAAGELVTKSVAVRIVARYSDPATIRQTPAAKRVRRYLHSVTKGLPSDEVNTLADELFRLAAEMRAARP